MVCVLPPWILPRSHGLDGLFAFYKDLVLSNAALKHRSPAPPTCVRALSRSSSLSYSSPSMTAPISYSASLHNELAKHGALLKWKEWQSGPRHEPMWCCVAGEPRSSLSLSTHYLTHGYLVVNEMEQCMGRGATKTLAKEAAALMTLSRLGLPVPQVK